MQSLPRCTVVSQRAYRDDKDERRIMVLSGERRPRLRVTARLAHQMQRPPRPPCDQSLTHTCRVGSPVSVGELGGALRRPQGDFRGHCGLLVRLDQPPRVQLRRCRARRRLPALRAGWCMPVGARIAACLHGAWDVCVHAIVGIQQQRFGCATPTAARTRALTRAMLEPPSGSDDGTA